MKKYPHGLTLNAVCAAIDDYQRHEDSVPEEGILAAFNTLLGHSDIADALRSMERTADVNMAAAQAMRDDMYHWKQRAEAAEAKLSTAERAIDNLDCERGALKSKLAELAKQEAIFQMEVSGNHWLNAGPVDDSDFTGLPDGVNLLYARPAPAADLADLVPDELTREAWRQLFINEDYQDTFRCGFSACRAAILRNIEEKLK